MPERKPGQQVLCYPSPACGEVRRVPVQDFGTGEDNNIQIIFYFVEYILSVQPSSGLLV